MRSYLEAWMGMGKDLIVTCLQIWMRTWKLFFLIFQQKHMLLGTQKNRLIESYFEHPKHVYIDG